MLPLFVIFSVLFISSFYYYFHTAIGSPEAESNTLLPYYRATVRKNQIFSFYGVAICYLYNKIEDNRYNKIKKAIYSKIEKTAGFNSFWEVYKSSDNQDKNKITCLDIFAKEDVDAAYEKVYKINPVKFLGLCDKCSIFWITTLFLWIIDKHTSNIALEVNFWHLFGLNFIIAALSLTLFRLFKLA